MTFRPATATDLPAALQFLRRHEATSMFPLSNLQAGLDAPGPYGTRLWIAEAPPGVIGLTRGGMVMPQWPDGRDWGPVRAALAGERIAGLIGPAPQVRALHAALGPAGPLQSDSEEPGFVLDLAGLAVPDGQGEIADLSAADPALLADWRAAFLQEVMGADPAHAARLGAEEVAHWRRAGSHRVLMHDGAALAICGFNAALPDVVQVGGVYVPPALRGLGHARRAVALLLVQARARGIRRAVLFAASDAAARAYRAIGFRPAAPFGRVLFRDRHLVRPWP